MLKIGIVVQRYGKEVVGGAETLARDVAERLNSSGCDVTVFTTTAMDYITWGNHFPAGESILKGVRILRYEVDWERDIESFNRFSGEFFSQTGDRDEMKWIEDQGPYTPKLIAGLSGEQENIDVFLFFTYLYYTTIMGLKAVQKPAVLFPTAHDEAPIYMDLMKDMFRRPEAILFLTGAEMEFVKKTFTPPHILELARTGLDIKTNVDEKVFKNKFLQFAPYILYAGRIERGKGLEQVFDAFRNIKKKRLVDLVLIGKKLMDIPEEEGIKYLGFVSEEEKLAAFKGAVLSIQPSPLESLSITTLESFSQKTPVLVNKKSPVLCEHIDISEGGLAYNDSGEFAQQFYAIYDKRRTRLEMGAKGYQYVLDYYAWDVVMEKITAVLKKIAPVSGVGKKG